ncbi:MAG: GNAT family N-acetyltransferase [Bacteroidia bacterium]
MNYILLKASEEHKIVIQNLMQYYIYDFSEYIKYDVEDNGLFAPYSNLMDYWEGDNNKFPYVIKMGEKYVGFVLIKLSNSVNRSCFSITEFFILKKYRREGIGKAIAIQVFNLYRGEWEVYQKDSNKPAQIFWNNVISKYTKGKFNERLEDGKRIQNFEN